MIQRVLAAVAVLAAIASAQTKFDNGLTLDFGGGKAAHIHTESSLANSLVSMKGVIAISEGDVSHRMVTDKNGKVVFAYDIALAPVPNDSRAFTVRVKPADPDHFVAQYLTFAPGDQIQVTVIQAPEFNGTQTIGPDGNITLHQVGEVKAAGTSPGGLAAEIQKRLAGKGGNPRVSVTVLKARREYPTIAAAREFHAVRIGDAVNLDILLNPSTGEKIFDVIAPIEPPAEKRRIAPQDEISLEEARILVNGAPAVEMRRSWMIGGAVKVWTPATGVLYLVVKPTSLLAFQPTGRVSGTKLTFPVGKDWIEIISKSNILKTSEFGTVWVYQDTAAKSIPGAGMTVGMAEEILPKRD